LEKKSIFIYYYFYNVIYVIVLIDYFTLLFWQGRLDRVRTFINEIQLHQDNFRLAESRDRSMGEANFERVNFWSALFIAATLVVLGLQVITRTAV